MKLKKLLENLNQMAERDPEILEWDCITATDDEGNGFNLVHYDPQLGTFENGEFEPSSNAYDKPVVCLN